MHLGIPEFHHFVSLFYKRTVLLFLDPFSRNAPLIHTFLLPNGEMKVKSIPKPPPLCTYVHASHVLMHSLHFIQKHKDPEMLSPFLKALIQMHPYIPECGFFLALLSRGWEGLCFQALDLTFQENKCSEAFKVSDLLSCL